MLVTVRPVLPGPLAVVVTRYHKSTGLGLLNSEHGLFCVAWLDRVAPVKSSAVGAAQAVLPAKGSAVAPQASSLAGRSEPLVKAVAWPPAAQLAVSEKL